MPDAAPMRAPPARKGTRVFRRGMVVVACVWVAVSATATVALAHERSEQTVIRSRDFTIARGQCTALPADLEIKGLGLERFTTVAARFNITFREAFAWIVATSALVGLAIVQRTERLQGVSMARKTLDAEQIMRRATPTTVQHAHEIHPFGHLFSMPCA